MEHKEEVLWQPWGVVEGSSPLKTKCKLKYHTEKLSTQLFEEKNPLEVPLRNLSSRMLNVFKKDVLSKINTQD